MKSYEIVGWVIDGETFGDCPAYDDHQPDSEWFSQAPSLLLSCQLSSSLFTFFVAHRAIRRKRDSFLFLYVAHRAIVTKGPLSWALQTIFLSYR